MPAVQIATSDLAPFATIPEGKATAMIADAMAMALLVAPCLDDPQLTDKKAAAAKAIIRGAILRWHEAGSGALSQKQQSAGPFAQSETYDTRQIRRAMYWPSEIEQLQSICRADDDASGGAWGYDVLGACGPSHSPVCTLNMGGTYCSCGANLTGHEPLWEAISDD
ncbi:hypothetical protein [Mycobacteroides abscessus]|uniref:hypothetical protein n=1 Tax=Mycobacteroides abscessus TaxID=36809 RepID=UPI0002F3269A|nr:hypothetical protein [Mycobacteroides abscessus]